MVPTTPLSTFKRLIFAVFAAASTLAAGGCTSGDDGYTAQGAQLFAAEITELTVEVDYQEDAAPIDGFFSDDKRAVWDVFGDNVQALFTMAPARAIRYPRQVSEMEPIPASDQIDYTTKDILALADEYRDHENTKDHRSIYIIFLDGFFFDDDQRQNATLGVSIGDTGVIAMFKGVINNTIMSNNGSIDKVVKAFIEQSTLTHEFGHSIGFVNNGLPMAQPHQDEEHGRHCTNENCVMFYRNEGIFDLRDFISRRQNEMTNIMYGDECLQDAYLASQKESAQ